MMLIIDRQWGQSLRTSICSTRSKIILISGTPVLNRKMTLRRETLKALETRRNSVMAERRKSQMQTLGANNEYGVTGIVRLIEAFK